MSVIKTHIVLLSLLLVVGLAPAAASQIDRNREEAAAREIAEITTLLTKLPPATPLARTVLPLPRLEAIRVMRRAAEAAALYADLPAALHFLRLRGEAAAVNGDSAEVAEMMKRVAEGISDEPIWSAAVHRRAEHLGTFGNYGLALELVTSLIERFPTDPRITTWQSWRKQWTEVKTRQDRDLEEIRAGINSRDQRENIAGRQVSARFAIAWPIHPEAANFAAALIKELGTNRPISDTLGYHERITLYAPQHPLWSRSAPVAARALLVEGEYERATLYLNRILERSQDFTPAEVQEFATLLKEAETRWMTILNRDLDVNPKTKSTRLLDIGKRADRRADSSTINEDLQNFEIDYPTCSEVNDLRLRVARSLLEDDFDTADKICRRLLSDRRITSEGRVQEVVLLLVPTMEDRGDPDALIDWLNLGFKTAQTPADKLGLGLELIRRYEQMDLPERGLEVLSTLDTAAKTLGREAEVAAIRDRLQKAADR